MKKLGKITLILTLLTTSIVMMLAKMSMHLDKIDGRYGDGIYSHVPVPVYIILGILYVFSFATFVAEE